MPEKLSQSQIDALLNRLNSGDVDVEAEEQQKKVKEYDFKSPKKFTKEQLKTLDGLHENFSRMLSSYFSGMLRVFCEVSVLQIEEMDYFEYNNALPDSALIGVVEMKPADKKYSDATLLMDLSTSIGFFMIDRLLGGSGDGYNLTRDFTDIEIAILENVFQKIVTHLQDAWGSYIEISAELGSIETNSRLLQAMAPEDPVVIVAMNMKIRNLAGTMSICIPAVNLEEVIGNFSQKYTKQAKRPNITDEDAKRKLIMDSLVDSDLEVKAVLDNFEMDLKEILELQVDDVIPLAKNINSDVCVMVDDTPWFTAKLGEVKVKKAVKLNSLIM